MYGKYTHSVDAKGRLFVPSKLREELGSVFYVLIGMDHCLAVYPEAKWKDMEEKFNALRMSQAPRLRTLYANLAKCEPDKQGRFLIPIELRQYARLTDEVTFLGLGDHAEIWNAADWAAQEQAFFESEDPAAALKELGF